MSGKLPAALALSLLLTLATAADEPAAKPLTGHERAVNALRFSLDGKRLASAGADRTIILWDPSTAKEIRRITAPQPLLSVEVLGGLVLASAPEVIAAWSVADGKLVGVLRGHTGAVRSGRAMRPRHRARRASTDQNAPRGRNIPQNKSIRRSTSAPLRIGGIRWCSEISISHDPIVAPRV